MAKRIQMTDPFIPSQCLKCGYPVLKTGDPYDLPTCMNGHVAVSLKRIEKRPFISSQSIKRKESSAKKQQESQGGFPSALIESLLPQTGTPKRGRGRPRKASTLLNNADAFGENTLVGIHLSMSLMISSCQKIQTEILSPAQNEQIMFIQVKLHQNQKDIEAILSVRKKNGT